MFSVLASGVAGSPVVPTTRIGPAPAPVMSTRGSSDGGKKVQKYDPVVPGARPRRDVGVLLGRRVLLLDGESVLGVHARDGLERLERVVVGAVGLALEVLVVEVEQTGAVPVLRGRERLLEARPEGLAVHRLDHRDERDPSGDVWPLRLAGDRILVDREHQLVERLLGVAAVVERAVLVLAALREELGDGRLEPLHLLEAALDEVGVRVRRAVEHRGAHGVGEQRRPRARRARCRS